MESQSLQRQPSIETEPKTLFHRELNLAKEAALEVIKKHTKEEALQIFLEGLKPVENAVKLKLDFSVDDDEELFEG